MNYAFSFIGAVFFIGSSSSARALEWPATLSETGYFENTQAFQLKDSFQPYEVNVPFWSDGVQKRRWFSLPQDKKIHFAAKKPWGFPRGTVLLKTFDVVNKEGTFRLETRVLRLEEGGWQGSTYRWRSDESDADLVTDLASTTIKVLADDGTERNQKWLFPAAKNCLECHNKGGQVLGLHTLQAHHNDQLATWNSLQLFDEDISAVIGALEFFPDISNDAVPIDQRARVYLDVNCASCHRNSGTAPGGLKFSYDLSLSELNAVYIRPSDGSFNIPDAYRIFPGQPSRSIVYYRMRTSGDVHMPKTYNTVSHKLGTRIISQWISQLH